MGLPRKSTRALPGKRVEAYRAGITARMLIGEAVLSFCDASHPSAPIFGDATIPPLPLLAGATCWSAVVLKTIVLAQ
jgi:hypothetical protein